LTPPRPPPRPAPKPNRPPALELRPGETGEPAPYRRQQDTLRGISPEHVAAARQAARERPELEPSLTPEQSQLALYRKRAEEAEARARKAEDRSASPPLGTPSQAPGAAVLDDAAIGRMVKSITGAVLKRVGLPAAFIAMLGLGGAGYKAATDKPAPPALTAEDLNRAFKPVESRLDKLTTSTNEGLQVSKCLRRKVNQIGGALLPDPQKMGTALKPQPYEDDCPDNPRPLPEP
jgi:hypothetical protein